MPANVAAVVDVPCEIFGGLVSDLAPTDLPMGASPDNQDVAFQIGLVKTRPGLQNVFAAIAGNHPTINYLKTFITQQQINVMLALDALGNVWKESPIGVLAPVGTVEPNEYCKSTSQFQREYMAFGNGVFGLDMPRQYDNTNFDRVSQCGPGAVGVAVDETAYTIDAGAGAATRRAGVVTSSLTFSNGIVTVTCIGVVIGFVQAGETVVVSGVTPAAYNGTFQLITNNVVGLNGVATYALPNVQSLAQATVQGVIASKTAAIQLDVADTTPQQNAFFQAAFPAGVSVTVAGNGNAAFNGTWTTVGRSVGGGNIFQVFVTTGATGAALGAGGTLTVNGNIPAGVHGVSVCFKTRQGYITVPAPVTNWTSAGSKRVVLTGLPIGPGNVVARIVIFTLAGGASYFYLTGVNLIATSNFIIQDNTTTSVILDFSDAILAVGTSADYLFSLTELEEASGVIDYSSRNFWWGLRNRVNANGGGGGFNNLSFDGGFGTDGNGNQFPLGWTEDAANYAGGGSAVTAGLPVVWGDAYAITGDGATAVRGLATQTAFQDVNNVPILQPNTNYSIRARLAKNAVLGSGTVHIHIFSASLFVDTGIDVPAAGLALFYQEFIVNCAPWGAVAMNDFVIRVYADGTPTNGGTFLIDNIEIFPTNQPNLTSVVRACRVNDPESFDGVNGLMEFGVDDGTKVTGAFKIRNNLYFVKDRSLWQTADDGTNEPSKWAVNLVSPIVGTPVVQAIGVGADWVIIAGRLGAYYFDGGSPIKVSQEIQRPVVSSSGQLLAGWDNINWDFGFTMWCQIDEAKRRCYIGAPTFNATTPNVVFVLDYRGLDVGREIVSEKSIHISAYTGKIYDIADSRKWTRWNMQINSANQIERPDGTQHLFMGNGSGTGKIYDLLDVENFTNPAQFGDDGVPIHSYYDTYFFLRPQEEEQYQLGSHRKLYRYLSTYIEGQGVPKLSAFPPGNAPAIPLPQSGAVLPPLNSPTFLTNILSIVRYLNTVTVITAGPHNITTAVVINGTGNAAYDGILFGNINVVLPNVFTFQLPGPNIPAINNTGTTIPLIRDIEIPLNIQTERCKFRVETNALGAWFSLRTLTPSIMTDPFAPVRGVN